MGQGTQPIIDAITPLEHRCTSLLGCNRIVLEPDDPYTYLSVYACQRTDVNL